MDNQIGCPCCLLGAIEFTDEFGYRHKEKCKVCDGQGRVVFLDLDYGFYAMGNEYVSRLGNEIS